MSRPPQGPGGRPTVRLDALAPAKINLCLFLGPARADGRHELVTLFESVSLCDELELEVRPAGPDEVVCPGVEGPNLVSAALQELRGEGWAGPPVGVAIGKRIPVAAGLGGGSADAAAFLRLAVAVEPLRQGAAERIARRLGADVPSQLRPGLSIGTGAGDVIEPVQALLTHAFVIVPQSFPLSTADVYREADRLELPRTGAELEQLHGRLRAAVRPGSSLESGLVVNDLEPAAASLAPQISSALHDVREAGAEQALLCGSGPTVAGVWWGGGSEEQAEAAARQLSARYPGAIAALPVADGASSPSYGTIAGGP